MNNIPQVKLGIVAVSRDCFPIALSEKRRKAIVEVYGKDIYECPVTVENELDMLKAVEAPDMDELSDKELVEYYNKLSTPKVSISSRKSGKGYSTENKDYYVRIIRTKKL